MHRPSPMVPEPPERRLSLVECYRFLMYDWGAKLPWSVHKNTAQHWTVTMQNLGSELPRIIAFLTTPTHRSITAIAVPHLIENSLGIHCRLVTYERCPY
jgi:hypothetical protein